MYIEDIENEEENERAWYIIQSYSGMEYTVKRNLERRIVSMNMQDYIFNVLIPEEIHLEKNAKGETKEVVENPYPGYIFVDMIVTDESWYIVSNTPLVTGFLGSSGGRAKPVPVPHHEMIPILKKSGITITADIKFGVGDTVRVLNETFMGQEAVVESIDMENQTVTVLIDLFGRQTPNELRFDEVEAIKK